MFRLFTYKALAMSNNTTNISCSCRWTLLVLYIIRCLALLIGFGLFFYFLCIKHQKCPTTRQTQNVRVIGHFQCFILQDAQYFCLDLFLFCFYILFIKRQKCPTTRQIKVICVVDHFQCFIIGFQVLLTLEMTNCKNISVVFHTLFHYIHCCLLDEIHVTLIVNRC